MRYNFIITIKEKVYMNILKINLYNGKSEIMAINEDLNEELKYMQENCDVSYGDRTVYMGEEVMYVVL